MIELKKNVMNSLKEYNFEMLRKHKNIHYNEQIFRIINKCKNFYGRLTGNFQLDDILHISNYMEVPIDFIKYGCYIPHPFGITLSAEEIGCDCYIGQNVTIGTNGKDFKVGQSTVGHRPRIGNLVAIYSSSIISGKIDIGDYVIIAANSFVDKNVPSHSIVYGINNISKLREHHYKYLYNILWHCINRYDLIPGMSYKDGKIYINEDWKIKRKELEEKYLKFSE